MPLSSSMKVPSFGKVGSPGLAGITPDNTG